MNRQWLVLLAFFAGANTLYWVLTGPGLWFAPHQAVVVIALIEVTVLVIGAFASLAFASSDSTPLWTTLGIIGAAGLGLMFDMLDMFALQVLLFVVLAPLATYANSDYEKTHAKGIAPLLAYFLTLEAATFWLGNSVLSAPFQAWVVEITVPVCSVLALLFGWRFSSRKGNGW